MVESATSLICLIGGVNDSNIKIVRVMDPITLIHNGKLKNSNHSIDLVDL